MGLDFTEEDFYLDIKEVKLGKMIGTGQFSDVYLALYFGDVVAVKKQTRDQEMIEGYLYRELGLLKNITHENFLKYIGACNVISEDDGTPHAVYIVTEYCDGGDLLRLVLHEGDLSWWARVSVLGGAARALDYLHQSNLIHRDIKSSNILLNRKYKSKLADFGFVRELGHNMTICGTDEYMAPELLFDEEYGISADVFSFGVVMVETLIRKKIGNDKGFILRSPSNCFQINFEELEACPEFPKDAPDSLISLCQDCLTYEAHKRPDANSIASLLEEILAELPPDPEDAFPIPEIEIDIQVDPGFGVGVQSRSFEHEEFMVSQQKPLSPFSVKSNSALFSPNPFRPRKSMSADCSLHLEDMDECTVTGSHHPIASHVSHHSTSAIKSPITASDDLPWKQSLSENGQESSANFLLNSPWRSDLALATAPWSPQTFQGQHKTSRSIDFGESEMLLDLCSALRKLGYVHPLKEQEAMQGINPSTPSARSQRFPSEHYVQPILPPITLEGWLYKRNPTGYKNWKKRWFMLAGPLLLWWRNEEMRHLRMYSPMGLLHLRGGSIKRTKAYRWQILNAQMPMTPPSSPNGRRRNEGELLDKELSAINEADMEKWITNLLDAMQTAYYIPSPGTHSASSTFGFESEDEEHIVYSICPTNVKDWLKTLRLEDLWPSFKKCGYNDISHIRMFGLTDDDLDFLGIQKTEQRRILKAVTHGQYAHTLQASVVGRFTDAGGDNNGRLVFRVRARWRTLSSDSYLALSDLQTLDRHLKSTLRGSCLLKKYPALPSCKAPEILLPKKEPVAAIIFYEGVGKYLSNVVALLGEIKPYSTMIRTFLNLDIKPHISDMSSSEHDSFPEIIV